MAKGMPGAALTTLSHHIDLDFLHEAYGITGNGRALHSFHEAVQREWHRWLNRRSQQHCMTWERFGQLLQHYLLPQPVGRCPAVR